MYNDGSKCHVKWETGPVSILDKILWEWEDSLTLVERVKMKQENKYEFVDYQEKKSTTVEIEKSGVFNTKSTSTIVYYEYGSDLSPHLELSINSQCLDVEDLEQLKAFIEFSINKLKGA